MILRGILYEHRQNSPNKSAYLNSCTHAKYLVRLCIASRAADFYPKHGVEFLELLTAVSDGNKRDGDMLLKVTAYISITSPRRTFKLKNRRTHSPKALSLYRRRED